MVSHSAIDRLLARIGTSGRSVARVPGPRYARSSPIELWHIDVKGPFFFQARRGPGPQLSLRRARRRLWPLPAGHPGAADPPRRTHPRETLEEAMELCAVSLQLMSDNGTPFVILVEGLLARFQRTRGVPLNRSAGVSQPSEPWSPW